jgi:uncharacterized membrane-anchored protein
MTNNDLITITQKQTEARVRRYETALLHFLAADRITAGEADRAARHFVKMVGEFEEAELGRAAAVLEAMAGARATAAAMAGKVLHVEIVGGKPS